jgi:predicted MFS family arabinose efflux permease
MIPDEHFPNTQASDSGFFGLMKNRSFLQLWVGQVFSQLADKIFLTLQVALLTKFAPLRLVVGDWSWQMAQSEQLLFLLVASTIPAILIGSAAGIFVDRHNKKSVLFHCNLWRGVMLIFLPLLTSNMFAVMIGVVFFESILTQFFAPAEQSAIPLVVRREHLISANSLFATTMIGSIVVGHAVGAPLFDLITQVSPKAGRELLVAALYIGAALLMGFTPMKETRDTKDHAIHPWSDFKAGLAYLKQSRLISNAMVQLMLIYGVFAALTVLSIELTKLIGLRAEQFGFLVAPAGLGMILGAALMNVLGDRIHRKPLPLAGFLIVAAVLGLFTQVHSLSAAMPLSALFGMGAILIVVPMQTLIQQETPASMRGKVFGFQNNVINIAVSLPLVMAEVLTKQFGLQAVMFGTACIVAVAGIWTWRISRRVLQDVI